MLKQKITRISKEIDQNKKQETTLPFLRLRDNQRENRMKKFPLFQNCVIAGVNFIKELINYFLSFIINTIILSI